MDQMLHRIAAFYDEEVEATTEALTSLIEPLMIAGLGLVVGVDDRGALHADLLGLRAHRLSLPARSCPVGVLS